MRKGIHRIHDGECEYDALEVMVLGQTRENARRWLSNRVKTGMTDTVSDVCRALGAVGQLNLAT